MLPSYHPLPVLRSYHPSSPAWRQVESRAGVQGRCTVYGRPARPRRLIGRGLPDWPRPLWAPFGHPLGTLWAPSGHPLGTLWRWCTGACAAPLSHYGGPLLSFTGMKSTDAFLREYVSGRRSNPNPNPNPNPIPAVYVSGRRSNPRTCSIPQGCGWNLVPVGCPLEPATSRVGCL